MTDGRGSRFDAAASAAVARLQASMHHHSPTLAASDYSGSGLAAPGDHSVVGHVGGSAGYWDTERSGVDAERGEINSFVDDILGDESTDQAMRYALRHSPPAHATQASRTGASAGPPAGGSGGSGSASAAAAAINDAAFSPSPGTRGARSAADGADSGGFGSSSSSSSSGGGSSSKASGAGPSSLDGRAPSADAVLKLSADNAEYDWSDDGSDYGDDGTCPYSPLYRAPRSARATVPDLRVSLLLRPPLPTSYRRVRHGLGCFAKQLQRRPRASVSQQQQQQQQQQQRRQWGRE